MPEADEPSLSRTTAVMAMGELYRWKESRDVPDTINAILQYPEGFAVSLGSSFNNQFSSEAGFQVLGTEGTLTITGAGVSFYPENVKEDNRWIVESWPKSLEDAYYKDPKVIAAEVAERGAGPSEVIAAALRIAFDARRRTAAMH